jgi:hypothetical protein
LFQQGSHNGDLIDSENEKCQLFQNGWNFCEGQGAVFGPRYLYRWWKRACKEVGVEDVDLYGGTRHSTVTALSKSLTPEEIKKGTMHSTNKAFERYFQKQASDAKMVYQKARNLQSGSSDNLVVFGNVKKL